MRQSHHHSCTCIRRTESPYSLATLTPHIPSLLMIVAVSTVWTLVYALLANKLMNARDIL